MALEPLGTQPKQASLAKLCADRLTENDWSEKWIT